MFSPESFVESGLQYFNDLVNASCFHAAVVVVALLFSKFPTRAHVFTTSARFVHGFNQIDCF